MVGGWSVLAASVVDCERLRAGWPDQPVNAWSSLAFVVVGVVLVIIPKTRASRFVAGASALTGAGSLLFHGGIGPFAEWLHDWSIAVLLLALLAALVATVPLLAWAAASAVLGALFAAAEGAAEPISMAVAAVVGLFVFRHRRRMRSRRLALAATVAAVGVAAAAMGRTGGPLCDPASLWQPHALWHVMSATAVLLYGSALGWFRATSPGDGAK